MSKHDSTRRKFLVDAALGAGAVAGAGLVPAAQAQSSAQGKMEKVSVEPVAGAFEHGAFFNYEESATVAALAERIMPDAPGKPGASDAGALNYIDLALSGAYASLQDFYRRGLAQLDAHCQSAYHKSFAELGAAQQDEVVAAMEGDKAGGFTWPTAREFFNTVRTHTMEGMFADPVYGGNKDFSGWLLVGFPGAQEIYTYTDLQNKGSFTRLPIIGLQEQAKKPGEA